MFEEVLIRKRCLKCSSFYDEEDIRSCDCKDGYIEKWISIFVLQELMNQNSVDLDWN